MGHKNKVHVSNLIPLEKETSFLPLYKALSTVICRSYIGQHKSESISCFDKP